MYLFGFSIGFKLLKYGCHSSACRLYGKRLACFGLLPPIPDSDGGFNPECRCQENPTDEPWPDTIGVAFSRWDSKLALTLTEYWASHYRRVCGYIGEIKFPPNDVGRYLVGVASCFFFKMINASSFNFGTAAPALLQMVVQLPFRHGKTRAETYDSWIHCRISAFISSAACDPPIQMLRVGGPVAGFIESTSSKEHFVAQLDGWGGTLASEWKLASAASSPEKIELNIDVISTLPQLSKADFPITHAPNVNHGRFVS